MPAAAVVFFRNRTSLEHAFTIHSIDGTFVGLPLKKYPNGNYMGMVYTDTNHPAVIFAVDKAIKLHVDDGKNLIHEMFMVNMAYDSAYAVLYYKGYNELKKNLACRVRIGGRKHKIQAV